MYIQRHLEDQVREASKSYPVVMVCGQRQVGKSTMLNHIKEEGRRYVTLDDGNARRLAETDPALFFETYGYPLLIDEFQRVPSILLEMKKIVDLRALDGEDNTGMYWLAGSQKFKMMKDVSESLAGRIAVFDMSGLSAAELTGRNVGVFHPVPEDLRERMRSCKPASVHEVYERIFIIIGISTAGRSICSLSRGTGYIPWRSRRRRCRIMQIRTLPHSKN
ncbi:MAG: AAA family ATPase [Clostridium sp.]|nr:AAA family ATPase [Acetatifactor muris]MCM1527907.1 AAA family ATPase [Bacteroides sp.]MCM1564026.1 AAA family ATPase [Clostridium sp.]